MSEIYLDHFIDAHEAKLNDALTELSIAYKKSHWIWFIFPIIKNLANSEISKFYEISSLYEAKAFIEHNYLGYNYNLCLLAILKNQNIKIQDILGNDAWKFKSSLTLFNSVTDNQNIVDNIRKCINLFFLGRECKKTNHILKTLVENNN